MHFPIFKFIIQIALCNFFIDSFIITSEAYYDNILNHRQQTLSSNLFNITNKLNDSNFNSSFAYKNLTSISRPFKTSSSERVINSNKTDYIQLTQRKADQTKQKLTPNIGRDGDTRVPFWNIAHMINSIEQVEPAIEAGSNGIEVDVSFDKKGYPVESYHGFPCDCGRHCHHRENFVDMVKYISGLTLPMINTNLLIVLFDLKLKGLGEQEKEEAGVHLASILHGNLYKKYSETKAKMPKHDIKIVKPPVRVVISINHVTDLILVKSFLNYLKSNRLDFMAKHVGFDVGMNDNLTDISDMWDQLNGATFNIWQGDGLTNCGNIVRSIDRLKNAISVRNGQGHFRKIYFWTADVMYQIRSVLRLGLDAILTNQPQRVSQVLDEPEFASKYRLATHFDDPFAQFWIKPSRWHMSIPSISEAVETVANIKQTSANFVKTIPEGLSAMIKKVQNTIATHIR